MKKTYNIFIAVFVLFVSCNDNGKETTTAAGDSSVAASAAMPETNAGAGKCSSLYLFRKGSEVKAASYDANGKKTAEQSSTVLNVTEAGGMTVAEVSMSNKGEGDKEAREFIGKYSCDGKTLYADLTSLFGSMQKDGKATLSGDPVQFPLNISDGETLPEASYTLTMNQGGKQMKFTTFIKNRKVEGMEKVTTPAGEFNCFKISAITTANVDVEGMDEKMKTMMESMKKSMPEQKFVMYFDPAISIVKVEMFTGGKLVSKSEITSIK